METLEFYLSPLGLGITYLWNFAVLSSVQVTVRLVRLYSLRAMLLSALILTAAVVPVAAGYLALTNLTYDPAVAQRLLERSTEAWQAYVMQNRLVWLPAAMVPMGSVGFWLTRRVLGFKRLRGAIFAAIAVGVLAAPWAALVLLPEPVNVS